MVSPAMLMKEYKPVFQQISDGYFDIIFQHGKRFWVLVCSLLSYFQSRAKVGKCGILHISDSIELDKQENVFIFGQ